jgi:hypothetical protein
MSREVTLRVPVPVGGWVAFVGASLLLCMPAAAQVGGTSLTWIPGSSVKVQQLIGGEWPPGDPVSYCVPPGDPREDIDWQTKEPLLNQTYTNWLVGGTDLGSSFEHGGQALFLFGDTLYFNAGDTMAATSSTDAASGLPLSFFTAKDGSTLLIQPQYSSGGYVDMGVDNVPAGGVDIDGKAYVVCKTGHTADDSGDFSVLTRYNDARRTFHAGRTLSSIAQGGHFIDVSLHLLLGQAIRKPELLIYGLGLYRHSNIYLATITASQFWTGKNPVTQKNSTLYFTGLVNGQPTWSRTETDPAVVPVVTDLNPDAPTIGNVSVALSPPTLGLWLMTFDGGRGSSATNGVYFCYAREPWGPWSPPQLIFNAARDGAIGAFIHDPSLGDDGLEGPTIAPANNDPCATRGGSYAPFIVERFVKVDGNTLSLYYTASTWNPYTVVLMRSDFAITAPAASPRPSPPRTPR